MRFVPDKMAKNCSTASLLRESAIPFLQGRDEAFLSWTDKNLWWNYRQKLYFLVHGPQHPACCLSPLLRCAVREFGSEVLSHQLRTEEASRVAGSHKSLVGL